MAANSLFRLISATTLVLGATFQTPAAEPALQRLEPQGGQRGTTVEVALFGKRLADKPGQILFYESGISVERIEAVDAKQTKCVLRLDENCRLGRHALRLRTDSGLSNLVTFHVSNLKEIAEVEPNDSSEQPQAIATDVVVNGVVKNGETDVFVVEVTEGERLSVEIEGIRLGRTLFDPLIELQDEDGTLLTSSDDQPAAQQDAFVSIRAAKAGRIFIRVRESAFRGSNAATYRLHIGRFPRPVAVYPPAAVAGKPTELRWIGETFDGSLVTVEIPATNDKTHNALAVDELGISPTGIPLYLCEAPPVLEVEPNNSREQANELTAPGVGCGIINDPKDKDFFRFAMKKGQEWDFRVRARELRSPLDAVIHVFGPDGKYLKGNDDDRGQPDSYLRFKAPADGEYTLDVEDRLLRGRKEMVYVIEITQPVPAVDLVLEERQRYRSQMINIPQGDRTAAMMTVGRKDFGGPMQIEYEGLPTGVECQSPALRGDFHRVPVLFTAQPDSALNATLPTVTAAMTENPRPVLNRFRQQTWLVRGRNNVHVWSHYADRPPVAVTKPLPFSIRMIEPKAPLVRGGSMQIKIVAERKDGFEKPIGVQTLYNPPGMSTNQSLSIPKQGTEVLIPVTANGKARTGEWKIVFLGRTNMNGRVECSTQLGRLTIAEPYFDIKVPTLTVHQGETVKMTVQLKPRNDFEGEADLQLLRLPAGVTASKTKISAGDESAEFELIIAKDARVGRHRGVGCKVLLTVEGEPVRYSQGYVDLCVDPPAETETAASNPNPTGQAS